MKTWREHFPPDQQIVNPMWRVGDLFTGAGGGQTVWQVIEVSDFAPFVIAHSPDGDVRQFYFDQMERYFQ